MPVWPSVWSRIRAKGFGIIRHLLLGGLKIIWLLTFGHCNGLQCIHDSAASTTSNLQATESLRFTSLLSRWYLVSPEPLPDYPGQPSIIQLLALDPDPFWCWLSSADQQQTAAGPMLATITETQSLQQRPEGAVPSLPALYQGYMRYYHTAMMSCIMSHSTMYVMHPGTITLQWCQGCATLLMTCMWSHHWGSGGDSRWP